MPRPIRCCPMLLACLLAACGSGGAATEPPPIPTPIGVGPRFQPPAADPDVLAGKPVGDLRCGHAEVRIGVHVELFAHGRVVIVPPGIGVASPFTRDGAYVHPHGCTYPIRTLDPTGVLEIDGDSRALVLGDLFRLWGQPLSATRLAGFRTSPARPVRAYVGGERWNGPPGAVPLTRHAEIVLELGPYIRPHRTFAFHPGL